MFFIILFGIKELCKLWKKTFKTIHQLSFFVGHPVFHLVTFDVLNQLFTEKCLCSMLIGLHNVTICVIFLVRSFLVLKFFYETKRELFYTKL